MFREMMKSKIHKAIVTEANLKYVGSVTIDADLMDAADLLPNEKVQIVNNNNGARMETYVITGKRKSGVICLNGAAARLVQVGDEVIIISYATLSDEEARKYDPKVVFVNEKNQQISIASEEIHGQTGSIPAKKTNAGTNAKTRSALKKPTGAQSKSKKKSK